ncbi:secondary thiamine-phosphate synthase enzyme YjbQ [Crocosphaera sp. XPORK-15E]|uniref:secondary thiamine-phosphate synthase enzyme YjbQ n=1 Tax=Crocosphaera sp. XPORK-15E TaxID=3110247 RepID=UPI002B21FE5E|nr:secondary thiamine-phosphate synthase enzyme YjbQ [Crocosphaera sp. XPORK-15E]MEA5534433.1 secondary thiamine-phosphate synthase enzyme YjbQ [Crocosphaera sp. XPORK-15E]
MNYYQQELIIQTRGKDFHPLTDQVAKIVAKSGINIGLCTIFVRHTSASLIIQENADPDVLKDLSNFLATLVPENPKLYFHSTEGVDDMPAHIRSTLTKTSEQIPISGGKLLLGTWQAIYLWEHRQHSHSRKIVIHIHGE